MSKIDKDSMLNEKQEMFCREYIVDMHVTNAAIRAGYSPKAAHAHGSRLLKSVKILRRINELKGDRAEKVTVTAEYVLEKIRKVVDESIDQPVYNSKGEQVFVQRMDENGEKVTVPLLRTDRNAVLKGSELLAKHLGMFTENINLKADITTRVQAMSDEELNSNIAQLTQLLTQSRNV